MTPQHSDTPDACFCCGRNATGAGLAPATRNGPFRWLCTECLLIAKDIAAVRNLDPYEKKALAGGMTAAGDVIAAYGPDLSAYSDDQAAELVETIWRGCADEIRRLIRSGEAPF